MLRFDSEKTELEEKLEGFKARIAEMGGQASLQQVMGSLGSMGSL